VYTIRYSEEEAMPRKKRKSYIVTIERSTDYRVKAEDGETAVDAVLMCLNGYQFEEIGGGDTPPFGPRRHGADMTNEIKESGREVVEGLLRRQLEIEHSEAALRALGVDLDGLSKIDGLEVALDLLGVPPDNTAEVPLVKFRMGRSRQGPFVETGFMCVGRSWWKQAQKRSSSSSQA
jgi:hypothetical protein